MRHTAVKHIYNTPLQYTQYMRCAVRALSAGVCACVCGFCVLFYLCTEGSEPTFNRNNNKKKTPFGSDLYGFWLFFSFYPLSRFVAFRSPLCSVNVDGYFFLCFLQLLLVNFVTKYRINKNCALLLWYVKYDVCVCRSVPFVCVCLLISRRLRIRGEKGRKKLNILFLYISYIVLVCGCSALLYRKTISLVIEKKAKNNNNKMSVRRPRCGI